MSGQNNSPTGIRPVYKHRDGYTLYSGGFGRVLHECSTWGLLPTKKLSHWNQKINKNFARNWYSTGLPKVEVKEIPGASDVECKYVVYVSGRPYCGVPMHFMTPDFKTTKIVDYDYTSDWIFLLCDNGIVRKLPIYHKSLLETVYPDAVRYGDNYRPGQLYTSDNTPYGRTMSDSTHTIKQFYSYITGVNRETIYTPTFFDLHMVSPLSPAKSPSIFPSDATQIRAAPISETSLPFPEFVAQPDNPSDGSKPIKPWPAAGMFSNPVCITAANPAGEFTSFYTYSTICAPHFSRIDKGKFLLPNGDSPPGELVYL